MPSGGTGPFEIIFFSWLDSVVSLSIGKACSSQRRSARTRVMTSMRGILHIGQHQIDGGLRANSSAIAPSQAAQHLVPGAWSGNSTIGGMDAESSESDFLSHFKRLRSAKAIVKAERAIA